MRSRCLLGKKMSGEEMDIGPRIDPINDFLESEIERLSDHLKNISRPARAGSSCVGSFV